MTDEYRRVLHQWAAANIPAHHTVAKVLSVELLYDKGWGGSDVTAGEDPSFGFLVRYLDPAGKEQRYDSTWVVDPGQSTRTMSQLLTELFRLSERPAGERS